MKQKETHPLLRPSSVAAEIALGLALAAVGLEYVDPTMYTSIQTKLGVGAILFCVVGIALAVASSRWGKKSYDL